ncbi:Brix-domain-containing protein [Exidia glandulosa HHB12029]|uniref:Brix-domain-containing protein n=1 Tax=Exidia glandulosa HHB12029 TaxID=1314781 RepID=A0A165DQA6_EXIGL|nr:Brix-domain-containing protein [Exidia glandulosa HHB12029]
MAPRRKTRTHLKASTDGSDHTPGVPKSFVIKHGQVGQSVSTLVRDLRQVMEPNTATRLKERSRNKLKDYLVMAPALHVSHLLVFTLTDLSPSLRIVRLPSGPTLSFRVERYSLAKDIRAVHRRAKSTGLEYLTPPLLVLASFPPPGPQTPPHLTLVQKTFQSMFPALSPASLKLSEARRVVLVAYNAERDTVDMRHFLISVRPYGVSKRVRRVLESATSAKPVLDLGNEQDVADFLLRKPGEPDPTGYESASSAASDAGDAVSLAEDYVGRGNKKGTKKAVKLDEIGPRMELKLLKITEGAPGKEGEVLYHALVTKTKKELAALRADHAAKEKLRRERREEQERRVAQKKEASKKGRKGAAADGEDEDDDMEQDENDEAGSDDGDAAGEGEYWDEEAEISEEDYSAGEGESSDDEPPPPRPLKKQRSSIKSR